MWSCLPKQPNVKFTCIFCVISTHLVYSGVGRSLEGGLDPPRAIESSSHSAKTNPGAQQRLNRRRNHDIRRQDRFCRCGEDATTTGTSGPDSRRNRNRSNQWKLERSFRRQCGDAGHLQNPVKHQLPGHPRPSFPTKDGFSFSFQTKVGFLRPLKANSVA